MKNEVDYDKIFSVIEKTISHSSFYWQSLSLILCFTASYFIYRFAKQFILLTLLGDNTRFRKNSEINSLIIRYLNPMLLPITTVLVLALGLSLYAQFFKEVILFSTTLKLVALFLFLRFLRISSDSTVVANIAGFFLVPALVLDIFDLLVPVIDYLDSYALKFGKMRISIYLVIKAFIVLLIVFWLSNLISRKSKSYLNQNKAIKSSTKSILSKAIDIIIYSTVFIIILKTLGVDMTTIAVLGGAVGVGIGFGLQKIASNFISGIILLFEKSVEIGDWVELDNGNIFGVVKYFGSRYTLIECFDGKEVMVPNEEFIVTKVSNWTYSNNRLRIEINIGVSYNSNLEEVKEVLISCAKEHPKCLNYPEVECYITKFDDHDIKFALLFWMNDITAGKSAFKGEVLMSIWNKFKEKGIEIPLPQREIKIAK